ncbi:MAG: ADP-glyceromanno-heptose 6-epimerase [Bacteroidetes bacterium]|nr:ADP-glyceromanno-heptose 6-epimerase [Bacteroidota bacterium]
MIVVTGAAGFIGSCLVGKMNAKGINDIIVVDDFSDPSKNVNLNNKSFVEKIHRDNFIDWLNTNYKSVEFIHHIGARTDTTEFDVSIFDRLNLHYSKEIWNACTKYQLPLVYASSAATYGMGEHGYNDTHEIVKQLKPLNPYGESKNEFDKWVLSRTETPPYWYGLKFFNVFGPNEYHKGRMASVIFHAYTQIQETGRVNLFRSHHPDFEDGMQLRDFIYVKDLLDVICYLMQGDKNSGLYNLGTGVAQSFVNLATATFKALNKKVDINFIDTPEDIRQKYQYFTEANMKKLKNIGYTQPFYSLENGINEYVQGYLVRNSYY